MNNKIGTLIRGKTAKTYSIEALIFVSALARCAIADMTHTKLPSFSRRSRVRAITLATAAISSSLGSFRPRPTRYVSRYTGVRSRRTRSSGMRYFRAHFLQGFHAVFLKLCFGGFETTCTKFGIRKVAVRGGVWCQKILVEQLVELGEDDNYRNYGDGSVKAHYSVVGKMLAIFRCCKLEEN